MRRLIDSSKKSVELKEEGTDVAWLARARARARVAELRAASSLQIRARIGLCVEPVRMEL